MKNITILIKCLILVVSTLGIMMAAASSSPGGWEPDANTKITSLVLSEMAQAGPGEKIPVIIILQEQPTKSFPDSGITSEQINSMKSFTDASQQDIVRALQMEDPSNIGNLHQLWIVNAVAVEATPATITKIAQRDDVVRIEPDVRVHAVSDHNLFSSPFAELINRPPMQEVTPKDIIRDYPDDYNAWGVEWIEAPQLWECGINGSGVNVSIIDTGIAPHPDIADRIVAFKDFSKNIAYNGNNAWYSGKGTGLNNTLLRNFTLGSASAIELEFYGKYDMGVSYNSTADEYTYLDYGNVQVSTDGVNWTTLAIYKGLSDGYLKESLDLSAYSGQTVQIRFLYSTSPGSYYNEGWYLDDLKITEDGTVTFSDGAESGAGLWLADGWMIEDYTIWSTGSMFYSGSGNNLDNTMERTFDFTGLSTVTLTFVTRYYTESGYDYGYVQVSTDSGASWSTLATYYGYSDFTNISLNLNSYAGMSNVKLRFYYHTDYSYSYEGWFVDDIQIPELGFYDNGESLANWQVNGWRIVTPDMPYDDHGHGTHVAGTVAGSGTMGIHTGIAPGASLMGAKVLDRFGYGWMSDVIQGVEWSVENGADVVSLSLGMNPVVEDGDGGVLNESETGIENIKVFSNPFETDPFRLDTPDAFQPTYIIGGVALIETTQVWEAYGYGPYTLERTFNLTGVTGATLEFETAYEDWDGGYVGEIQASTDGVTWDTLAEYSGDSYTVDSWWINNSLSLNDYTGSSITLRFMFEPYDYGEWQIDDIKIPEIGFYDDVESGNSGWVTSGWYIEETWIPVDIAHADISLNAPDGTPVSGDEAEWLYQGMVPNHIWFYKYTGSAPLQPGEWNLSITSNFNGTLEYETIFLVGYPSDGTDAASQALDTSAGLGVVPVVSAGNDGIFGLHTIGSPGASGSAITVGATEYMMDYIADFSSRGPVGFGVNETIKPDIAAPGTSITSLDTGNWYRYMSGTSMAAPHVSGAAALLLQADSSLTPAQVKQTLMDTSVDLGETGKDNSYGAGRISAYAAVNATVTLPDPVYTRPDKYELFAGATVDDIYLPPVIRDPAGDAASYADILGVRIYPYSTNMYIYIYTSDAPDLTLSEFRFAMDTDQDTSTGSNAIDPALGADYAVLKNNTGTYLYRWDSNVNDWQMVQTIYGYASTDYVYFNIPYTAINETDQYSVRMNIIASSHLPDGTVLDSAPDSGYGTYPWMDVTIDMVGISWNDLTGLPEQGMNITFEVQQYRSSPYYDYITIAYITNTTDSQGMAKASWQVNQTGSYENYYVYISDETGNEISDYVYAYADYSWLYQNDIPFWIPAWKDYYAAMNSTLPVKLTMVTPDWEPYNNDVTLVFGDYYGNYPNISAVLTPTDGTIEYTLDISGLEIQELIDYYYGEIPIRVLNGTLNDYDYVEYIGYLEVYDEQWYVLELSPDISGALSGGNVSYLVETYISNMTTDRPVSESITGEILWLNEVEVMSLGLPPSTTGKLDIMRAQMEETGRNDNLLTKEEQHKLLEAVRDLEPQNMGYNFTTFETTTDATGLGQFDVDVPADAYYGLVLAEILPYTFDAYDDAIIFVYDNFDFCNHPTAPRTEVVDYYLDIYADWDSEMVGGTVVPDTVITVEVWLEEYDPQLEAWIDVPNQDVYLYATTGDMQMVTTDADGYAEINLAAPSIDVLNSTWAERRVQVWGVTSLLTPYEEIAVAEDDWAYLDISLLYNYSIPDIEINNNNLDITLEFKDHTWTDTTNVPTVLDVHKSADSYWWSSMNDLMSAYINSPTTTWQTSIPLTGYGTYSVYTSTEYPDLWGYESILVWESDVTYVPYDIVTDIQYEYPRGITQPITVTIHDLQGQPVEGVSVYLIEEEYGYYDDYFYCGSDYGWSHINLETTDSTGTATLTLKTPDRDTRISYRIGGATSEIIFPYIKSGAFYVRASSNKPELYPGISMPKVIETGDTVNINVTVYNKGGVDSNASQLYLYRDTTLIQDFSIPVLPARVGSHDVSTTWTADTAGQYTWRAVADATNTNGEDDENNNELLKIVNVGQPDLIVSDITVPTPVQKGTTVNISATVRNIGVYSSGETTFEVKANDAVIGTGNVTPLSSGQYSTDTVSWTPAAAGDYVIQVTADPANNVAESNETNNASTVQVTVVDKPDLIPALQLDTPARINKSTNMTVIVYNIGMKPSNATSLDLYIDGTLYQTASVPIINALQSWTYDFMWTPTTLGPHNIRAVADPDNLVNESIETNNETSGVLNVGFTDLMTRIYSRTEFIINSTETIRIIIYNRGSVASEPTTLNVTVDGTVLFDDIQVPSISGGNYRLYTTQWTPDAAGDYTVYAGITDVNDTDVRSDNDIDTHEVHVRDYNINLWYMYYPYSPVYEGDTFYVTARFATDYAGMVDATIDLPDGLSTGQSTKSVTSIVSNYNYVWWLVRADEIGTYNFSVTITAHNKNSTINTTGPWNPSPGGWTYSPHGPVRVLVQTVLVKDSNSTLLVDTDSDNTGFRVFNVTMLPGVPQYWWETPEPPQSIVIDVAAGAQGRMLVGLEYLTGYPHACPEQTISPMLAAKRVEQYYLERGSLTPEMNATLYDKVRTGVNMMSPDSTANPQQIPGIGTGSGGWAWGTGTPTMFYTVYTHYGMGVILNNTNYSHLVYNANIDVNESARWIIDHQNTDGSWSGRGYISGNVPMTGFTMMALEQTLPYLNTTMYIRTNNSLQDATAYLLSKQMPNGGWNKTGSYGEADAYSTSLALFGLIDSGNDSMSVNQAINNGIGWLVANQHPDGSWSKYAGSQSYSWYGDQSETTAYAALALNKTGIPSDTNNTLIKSVNYLMGIYENRGSWGSTKSTQTVIHALTVLQVQEDVDTLVTVQLGSVLDETYHLDSTHPHEKIRLNQTQMDQLGFGNHTINVTTTGTGKVLVGVESRQNVPVREAFLKVPHRYIDPIADNFTLGLALPGDMKEGDLTTVSATINNLDQENGLYVMIIEVPLSSNITFPGTSPANTAYYMDGEDKVLVQSMYNASENKLYIYPGSDNESIPSVDAGSSKTFYFNVTTDTYGEITLESTVYPMYNETLMNFSNTTGYVMGYGNVTINTVDENGSAISASIKLNDTILTGTALMLEADYNVNITQAGVLPVVTDITVNPGVDRVYTAHLLTNLSEPSIVFSETNTTALPAQVSDEAIYSTYNFTVISSGGHTVIAMELPENYTFESAKVDDISVTDAAINESGIIYVTADLTGDSQVSITYRMQVMVYAYQITSGWNMVSVPVMSVSGARVSDVFGSNVTTVFGWTGTRYQQIGLVDELAPKEAYWVLSNTGYDQSVIGAPLADTGHTLSAGWNMVGPVSGGVTVETLANVTTVFGWTGTRYQQVTGTQELEQTKGYWMLASQSTTIQI